MGGIFFIGSYLAWAGEAVRAYTGGGNSGRGCVTIPAVESGAEEGFLYKLIVLHELIVCINNGTESRT